MKLGSNIIIRIINKKEDIIKKNHRYSNYKSGTSYLYSQFQIGKEWAQIYFGKVCDGNAVNHNLSASIQQTTLLFSLPMPTIFESVADETHTITHPTLKRWYGCYNVEKRKEIHFNLE